MKRAIVIGAGIAGIAAALRLRNKGLDVKVFESAPHAGGKLHAFKLGDYRFDMGPSLFTMPQLVDELFELFNRQPEDYFTYHKKEVVCNYFWENGKRFSVPADPENFVTEAAKTFDVSAITLKKYLAKNKAKYDLTADIFLNKSLHKWDTYFSFSTLKSLLQTYKLDINATLDDVNTNYFDDPHLQQLFNRYATYNGSSPYKTPGIMSMIPHLEMFYGTFLPKGGMHEISQSLYRLAMEQGVEFCFEEPVTEITYENKWVKGIITNKSSYNADIVISNTDVFTTYEHLLKGVKKPEKILKQERSSSAVIFYWGINRTFEELDLHNILFSENYNEEFDAIFNQKTLYQDPTVYINITSKEEPNDAPTGCENWFVMVNAPGDTGQDWSALIAKLKENVIAKINRNLHCDITNHIEEEKLLTPIEIATQTGSHQGSLYGTSSNSKFAAFLRHSNFSNQFKNLYFCGGSVHPGGGIPLCLLSAKIATDQIKAS